MNALRVVIADDEPLARLRLRRLLSAMADVEVVAECASGIEVMQLLPDCPCDLLLLDIQMPGADGFQALEHLLVQLIAIFKEVIYGTFFTVRRNQRLHANLIRLDVIARFARQDNQLTHHVFTGKVDTWIGFSQPLLPGLIDEVCKRHGAVKLQEQP